MMRAAIILSILLAVGGLGCTKKGRKRATKPQLVVAKDSIKYLADFVAEETKKAAESGWVTVIYVSSHDCEPCQKLEKALKAGWLDRDLPRVSFLKFDVKLHSEGLKKTEYQTAKVPLFAIPSNSGQSSGQHITHSFEGANAIKTFAQKLNTLLAESKLPDCCG